VPQPKNRSIVRLTQLARQPFRTVAASLAPRRHNNPTRPTHVGHHNLDELFVVLHRNKTRFSIHPSQEACSPDSGSRAEFKESASRSTPRHKTNCDPKKRQEV